MRNKTVAAVVVTYNRKALLLENIEALLSQTRADICDVIIIDNASSDGTQEALLPYVNDGRIKYINTGSNLGGAGGFQRGIRYAAESGYEFVWVMDDDCIPEPDALDAFIEKDRELSGNYGFLSSKVLWKDGSVCTMNVQRRTISKNVTDFGGELIPVVMASFVSLFIPIKVVKEYGLPIKEFFIWTDDWEYTRRISRSLPCYLLTGSVVVHKSKSNIGANIVTETPDRLDRFNYLYRNDVYLYRREGLRGFFYEFVRLGGHTLRVLLKAKDNKAKRIKLIIGATAKGLSFKPEIEFADTAEN